jgi:hypothetical protein
LRECLERERESKREREKKEREREKESERERGGRRTINLYNDLRECLDIGGGSPFQLNVALMYQLDENYTSASRSFERVLREGERIEERERKERERESDRERALDDLRHMTCSSQRLFVIDSYCLF